MGGINQLDDKEYPNKPLIRYAGSNEGWSRHAFVPCQGSRIARGPHRAPARYLGAKCLFIDEVQNAAAVVLKNQQ